MNKRLTRGQAINMFCRECMGYDGYRGGKVGTPFKKAAMMVKDCPDKECPLWPYRTGIAEQGYRTKRGFACRSVVVPQKASNS